MCTGFDGSPLQVCSLSVFSQYFSGTWRQSSVLKCDLWCSLPRQGGVFLTSQKWRAAGKAECSYEPLNCCRWWEEICRFFCFTAARCRYRNCGAFLINAVLRSRLCTEYFKCLWGETQDLSFFFSFLIVGILFQEIRLFFVSVWLS